jgi:hypothetical protein
MPPPERACRRRLMSVHGLEKQSISLPSKSGRARYPRASWPQSFVVGDRLLTGARLGSHLAVPLGFVVY